MKPRGVLPLALALLFLSAAAVPALATSAPDRVSYNPPAASVYHAPLSDMGLIAVTHAFPKTAPSLAVSGASPSSSLQNVPTGLVRFINDSSYVPQTETTIAVDPSTPSHVVGGFNDGRYFFCPDLLSADCSSGYTKSVTGFTTSEDGGATVAKSNDLPGVDVTERNLTSGISSPGFLLSWGDPSLAATTNGAFYFASLAIDPVTGANGIMIAVSNSNLWNPAVSCSTPLSTPSSNACWTPKLIFANLTYQCSTAAGCFTSTFEDKETVAVDMNPSSAHYGDVYVAWDHFLGTGESQSYLAVCNPSLSCTMLSGGGQPVVSGTDPFAGFSTSAVGADGTVYATWCNFGTFSTLGPVSCSVRSSPPGGTSFGTVHSVMSFMGVGTDLPGDSAIQGFATEQFRTSSELTIAAGGAGSVYFAIAVCVSGAYYQFQGLPFLAADNPGLCGDSAVFFTRSTDGGVNWSTPTPVSPQAVVIQPTLAVDPGTGAVVLAYYTSQYDPFNHRIDVNVAVSNDQGQTFATSRVTSVSNEPNSDPSGFDYMSPFGGALVVPQYGDYFTATALNGKILVLFTGNYASEHGTYQTDPFLAVVGETPVVLTLGGNAADAAPGDSVGYGVAGLTPGSPFTLSMDWGGTTVLLANGTVGQGGRVVGDFTVPNVQSQVYTLVAKDGAGLYATSTLGVGQVSLSPIQSALANLQTQLSSLQQALGSVPAQLSSLNSSILGSLNQARDSIASSVSALGSSVTGTASAATTTEYLLVIALVLLVVLVALNFTGRRKSGGAGAGQPTQPTA